VRRHAKASPAGSSFDRRVSLPTLVLTVLALLAFASSASAATKTTIGALGGPANVGAKGGEFQFSIGGTAVNATGEGGVAAGSFYVVDGNNRRVQQFKPNGEFERAFGANVGGAGVDVCTVAASCVAGSAGSAAGQLSEVRGIAIDQANGIVYVSDRGERRINVFSATGAFQGAFGWGALDGSEAFQYCTTTCHAPAASAPTSGDVPGGQFGPAIGGLAVDSSGKVYVADAFNSRVDVFTPTISAGTVTAVEFTRAFGWGALDGSAAFQVCNAPAVCHAPAAPGNGLGQFGAASPSSVAVDSAGNLYALDAANRRIEKFDSTPAPVPAFDASTAIDNTFGENGPLSALAFDPSASHLYLLGISFISSPPNRARVVELNTSGTALAQAGTDLDTNEARGIAVAPASLGGNLYVSSDGGGKARLFVLNEPPVVNATTTYTGGTTATFNGSVVSNNSAVTYRFEYSADGGSTWTKVPASDASVPAAAGAVAVSQDVNGLTPSHFYKVRLAQTMPTSGFPATSAEASFASRGPLLSETAIDWGSITPTAATVLAEINPNLEETNYEVEYVTKAEFDANGFDTATTVPVPPAVLEPGSDPVAVSQEFTGLSPVTTYYFRFSATNATSTTIGPALFFSTAATEGGFATCANDVFRSGQGAALPDCRAYEQASPVDKGGGRVVWGAGGFLTNQASLGGERISFVDNSGLPTSGGSGETHPIFIASRNGGEWSTDGLAPLSAAGSQAYVFGWNPELTASAATVYSAADGGFYVRDAAGQQHRAIPGVEYGIRPVSLVGSRVIFESEQVFASEGGEGVPNLFDLEGEETSLLSRVPVFPATSCDDEAASDCVEPAGGAMAGPYYWQSTEPNLSRGGANELNLLLTRAVSADGSRVFFTEAGNGRLFVREDGTRTTQISASQRTTPDPNGEKAAAFTTASEDGSVAFFLSCEKLTDDSTAVSAPAEKTCSKTSKQGQDLYAYDADSGQLTDLTVDHEAGDVFGAQVVGVLGASADGSHVYFAANGVLAPGATAGNCNISLNFPGSSTTGVCSLYLYHAGTVTYVARLGKASGSSVDGENWSLAGEASSRVSANGTLLFTSVEKLTGADNQGIPEFYRYAPDTAALSCVSCDPTGGPPVGKATLQPIGLPSFGATAVSINFQTRNISANGKRVFFESPDRLVPADVNGLQKCPDVGIGGTPPNKACTDVYEWEAPGEGSCAKGGPAYYPSAAGCLYLLSSGTSDEPSFFADASRDGGSAFIFVGDQLVPQDKDDAIDVYAARVDGGLVSQYPAPPLVCEGEACRGAGSSASATTGAGTAVFQGPGNPAAKHKKKAHHKKHKKKRRRHAKRNGGGK
jgi:hypothetical protein